VLVADSIGARSRASIWAGIVCCAAVGPLPLERAAPDAVVRRRWTAIAWVRPPRVRIPNDCPERGRAGRPSGRPAHFSACPVRDEAPGGETAGGFTFGGRFVTMSLPGAARRPTPAPMRSIKMVKTGQAIGLR
jgi:hypothetical protein